MEEPTGHTIDGVPWDEPRGPHLPDRLTGIPRPVWPFVVVALVQLASLAGDLRSMGASDPGLTMIGLVGRVSLIAPTLMGAALFWRHPDATRSMPLVAWAVVLFALEGALALLSGPLTPLLMELTPPSDDFAFLGWGLIGWQVIGSVVGVLAFAGLGRGLDRARVHGARLPRVLVVAIVGIAIVATAAYIPVLLGAAQGPASMAQGLVAVCSTLASLLALGYVFVVAVVGWRTSESPALAWGLASAGAGILIATAVANLVGWLTYVMAGIVPLEVFTIASAAGSLALLAAFVVGVPAVPDVGASTDVTPGPPAATPRDSEGS